MNFLGASLLSFGLVSILLIFCFTEQRRQRCRCFFSGGGETRKGTKAGGKKLEKSRLWKRSKQKSAKQAKVNQHLTPSSACDPEDGENYCGHCMWGFMG